MPPEKLFLAISRGPHAGNTRPVVVSDNQGLVHKVIRTVAEDLGLHIAEATRRLDDCAGLKLVPSSSPDGCEHE